MELVIDEPNEKQKLALKDHHKFIAYGGARGGGKSWFVRTKTKLLCANFPKIRILIIRRTYPELRANHINPLKEELHVGTKYALATYNDSNKEMRFKNGSLITFGYCNTESDVDRYQGTEADVIFFDEATQLAEMWIKKISACMRGVNEFPKRIYYTCNPGGQGHAYIKRLFIDKKYEKGERPEDYFFIQSLVTDNKALLDSDPDYVAQLEALPDKLRKAWLEGSWDIFEGQFFEEFRDDPEGYETHQFSHVIKPFDIPKSWPIYMGYDFGYSKPFSFLWFAISPDDVMYIICELYGCTGEPNEGVKWIAPQQFEKVKDIEAMHPLLKDRKIVRRIADPAIWKAESGESVAETAAAMQIYFDKADNSRIAGWMQMHYRLAFDDNGYAKLYVFDTCKHFIRTMPLQTYSETIPEDLDSDLEDHCEDACRYVCMARPIAPRSKAVNKPIYDDPLNLQESKKKNITYLNI